MPGRCFLRRQPTQPDNGRPRCDHLARDGDGDHLVGLGPCACAHPVDRDITRRAPASVVAFAGLDVYLRVGVYLDLVVVTVQRGVDVQATQPDHRREPPGLFPPARDRVGVDVEGREPVQRTAAVSVGTGRARTVRVLGEAVLLVVSSRIVMRLSPPRLPSAARSAG